MENRSYPFIKVHAAQRYVCWHFLPSALQNIRVCEFPKSGGTWLSQMLGDLFDLPYPRNSGLPFKKCIQHEHYPGPSNHKTILVVRDGRDVLTSAFFHFLVAENKRPPTLLKKWRNLMGVDNFDNVEELLPKFIEVFNDNYKVGGRRITWSQHIRSFDLNSNKIIVIKYEDLLKDAFVELEKISNWYSIQPIKAYDEVIQKYSFKSQTNRPNGEEDKDSFLRKGISGDWKNYFNESSIQVFNKLHKETLEDLGYV